MLLNISNKYKMKPDKTDPICGMKGHIKAHGHYFCSHRCIEKYEKQNKIKRCLSCDIKGGHKPWYKERLYVVGLITIALILISYLIPALSKLYDSFIDYFKLIWWAILLGLFVGGIIDHLIPREYISKFLATHKKRSIFYAVGFGFLMSACSHGILAIAIQLYKKGASTASVIAFLLASPWANLPITVLLFGFFGLKALYLVVSAIVIGIITGFVYQLLDRKGKIEKNPNSVKTDGKFSIKKDMKKRFENHKFSSKDITGVLKGSWALAKMVVWWILIGMILAAFVRTYVPHEFFMKFMGPTLIGLAITLIFATIIEVCSEGSSFLAFEIFNQTGAFGNSFTFLMAGVATDYTEIGLIWSNIGKKTALWLPVITIPQIFILGYLFNLLL
ncbi:ATPase [Candidatus Woesearchaeota archaeon B3_Woes]|nr:MAG: ATPase [Candidatus Woesearchaeota archaeon B3_Woes]